MARGEQDASAARTPAHEELLQMYERMMRLTADNKITKGNAFDMEFIEHLPSLINAVSTRCGGFSFHPASCTLDAGVKIYSRRVEALGDDVYSNLHGVRERRGAGDGNESGDEGAGAGEADTAAEAGGDAPKRKRRGGGDASSMLDSVENLKKKDFKVTLDADPLFARTCKLFDENNVSGLLLLNMPVFYHGNIMFESSDVPQDAFVRAAEAAAAGGGGAGGGTVDLSPLADAVAEVLAAAGRGAAFTPAISLLYEQLEGGGMAELAAMASVDGESLLAMALLEEETQQRRWHSRAAASGSAAASGGTAESMGASAEGGHPSPSQQTWADSSAGQGEGNGPADDDGGGGSWGDDPADDGGGGDDGGGWQDGDEGAETGKVPGDSSAAAGAGGSWGGSQAGDGRVPQPHEAQEGEDEELDVVRWMAGADQPSETWGRGDAWRRLLPKFAAARMGAKAAPKRRTRPADVSVDFESPAAEGGYDVAFGTAKQTQRRAVRRVTVTPETISLWKGVKLDEFSLLPGIKAVRLWRCRNAAEGAARARQRRRGAAAAAAAASPLGDAFAPDNDFDDNEGGGIDGGGYDDYEDGDNNGGYQAQGTRDVDEADPLGLNLLLLPAPRIVRRIDVNYSRTAKHVDVKVLKEALDIGMKSMRSQGAAGMTQEGAVSFKQVVNALPPNRALGPLSEVSAHLCFICLLHLVNEQGLELTNGGRLDTLHVRAGPGGGGRME